MCTALFSQKDETLAKNMNFRITGAWGGNAHGISIFKDDIGYTHGGFGGVEISKNFLIGGGGQHMSRSVRVDDLDNRLNLDYGGFLVGYSPSPWRVFHPQFNVIVGGGDATIYNGDNNRIASDNVFVIQPSAGFEVNVFRWFRIQAQGGYRVVSQGNFADVSNADMSSPFGQIAFKFGWSWGK